jgi:hypothetical protein
MTEPDKQSDKELDEMIKDGYIRAKCPYCLMPLESVQISVCPYCNESIDSGKIWISLIDWEKAN